MSRHTDKKDLASERRKAAQLRARSSKGEWRRFRLAEEQPPANVWLDDFDAFYTAYTQGVGPGGVVRLVISQEWRHSWELDTVAHRLLHHDQQIGTLQDKVDLLQPIVQRLARHYEYADPVPQIESPMFDRDRLLDEIEAHVSRLEASFDEPVERLKETIGLKEALRGFWRHVRQTSDRYLSDVAGMLYDAWRKLEAEALTREQVDGLRRAIESLRRVAPLTLEDAISMDKQLRAAGLESLPI